MKQINPKIAFIGDLTVDVYKGPNPSICLGGSSLNAALWNKRGGGRPSILAAVGNDSYGTQFKELTQKKGINGNFIETIDGQVTSQIEIIIDENGERHFASWIPGALMVYHLKQKHFTFLSGQDAVLLTLYGPTKHLLEELVTFKKSKKQTPLLAVDFGDLGHFDKNLAIVARSLPLLDAVFFGLREEEKDLITEIKNLTKKYTGMSVITLGKAGCVAFKGDQTYRRKAQNVRVLDTTGAGDAFIAGFLVEYLTSKNIQEGIEHGARLATQVIQQYGAY